MMSDNTPQWLDGLSSRLDDQFKSMLRNRPRFTLQDSEVSEWAVGQHIHHLALAASSMCFSLITGRSWQGSPLAPELKKRILDSGRIPAGRANAPDGVSPDSLVSGDEITSELNKAKDRVSRAMECPEDATMVHPYLGELSRDESLRFIEIHNDHHLEIVGQIVDVSE